MEIYYSELKIEDYAEFFALWKRTAGIGLSSADEFEPMKRFLDQNTGLCFAAKMEGKIVGTVLCGSDGRRGYLYHLAVDEMVRRQGIGNALVGRCLDELSRRGIQKCHLMVFESNLEGQAFWTRTGWIQRSEIMLMSKDTVSQPGAGSSPC